MSSGCSLGAGKGSGLERELVCKDSGDRFQETWEFGANRDLLLPAAVQGTKQELPLPCIAPLAASLSR